MLRSWLAPLAVLGLLAPFAACGAKATPEQCVAMCSHSIEVNGYAGADQGVASAGLQGDALTKAQAQARKQVDEALSQAQEGKGPLGESYKGCVSACDDGPPSVEIVKCVLAAETGDAINACVR